MTMRSWRALVWIWLGLVIALAYPCLWMTPSGQPRDAWFAAAVTLAPLLRILFNFPVATPNPTRKMMTVEKDVLRRMGLVFGLALTLYLLDDTGLKETFWAWLILFYHGMLAIDIGLKLSAKEQADGAREEPSSINGP